MLIVLLSSIIISIAIGSTKVPIKDIFLGLGNRLSFIFTNIEEVDSISDIIIFQVRLPRIVLAMLIGAALSVCGLVFQGLFRNPLADPGIIGVSSGASLGATIGILLQSSVIGAVSGSIPIYAFLGAIGAVSLVYALANDSGKVRTDTFLLSGVVVGSFISAIVSFLIMVAGQDMPKVIMWMMGNISSKGWDSVLAILPYILIGLGCIMFLARGLNLISVGEEPAKHMGLNVEIFKKVAIVLASLVAAASVSVAGIIGFVGFVVPHSCRMLVGPEHRKLIPITILAGAAFLVICDTIARVLLAPVEIPVGVITAITGTPFFLILLRKNKASKVVQGGSHGN